MGEWRRAIPDVQRHPRFAVDVEVRISTIDAERDPNSGKLFFRSAEETTANMSRGGAFVRSWEPLEAGRRVVVDIDLRDGSHMQLMARVAWTQRQLHANAASQPSSPEPGFGIEFEKASAWELDRLDRYLGQVRRPNHSRHAAKVPSAPQP